MQQSSLSVSATTNATIQRACVTLRVLFTRARIYFGSRGVSREACDAYEGDFSAIATDIFSCEVQRVDISGRDRVALAV